MSHQGNRWRFQTLPSEPNMFDPDSSIFRATTGSGVFRAYNCVLCNHDPMRFYPHGKMVQHCKDTMHCASVQKLLDTHDAAKTGLLACLSRHNEIEPRIKLLGLPAWRDKVRSDVCLYFGSAGKDSVVFARAVNNLFKYEHMERISLLELAAWKAACVLDTDESKQIHEMLEWVHHGWKQNKTKMRRSTATTVIVQNVVRFLERPRKITRSRESLDMFTPSL